MSAALTKNLCSLSANIKAILIAWFLIICTSCSPRADYPPYSGSYLPEAQFSSSGRLKGKQMYLTANGVTRSAYVILKNRVQPAGVVLILADDMGISAVQKNIAQHISRLGYNALVIDIFGDSTSRIPEDKCRSVNDSRSDNLGYETKKALLDKANSYMDKQASFNGRVLIIDLSGSGDFALEYAVSNKKLKGLAIFADFADLDKEPLFYIKHPVFLALSASRDFSSSREIELQRSKRSSGSYLDIETYRDADIMFWLYPECGNRTENTRASLESWFRLERFLLRNLH